MLAGGMVIAAPAMVPEAAAAGALYVSAENEMFNNHFGGAQIIEVVVINAQNETDEKQGEPVVKVDENQLRMAQANDGNWYGYFGDSTAVAAADDQSYFEFGVDTDPTVNLGDFSEATNVYTQAWSNAAQINVLTNAPTLSNYNNTLANQATTPEFGVGQIGVAHVDWPFIQLYDLSIENFDVRYEQAGADEVVSLNYVSADVDDYASLTLDRNSGTQGANVHLTITDNQLNIDPTAEDIVTFYVGASVDSSNGVSWNNRTATITVTDYIAYDNNFGDNGRLLINNSTNGNDSVLQGQNTIDDGTGTDNFMVFYEGGENSGIFYNTDDADKSSIIVNSTANRFTTATFDYNDSAQSYIVSNDFGTLDMDETSVGDEWNSGESLVVTLVDQDLNKNTLSDEDMTLSSHNSTIPSLMIGSPITLDSTSTLGAATMGVSTFNKIGTILASSTVADADGNGNVTLAYTATTEADFRTAYDAATYTFINYNVTKVINVISGFELSYANGTTLGVTGTSTNTAGLVELTGTISTKVSSDAESGSLELNFTGTTDGINADSGETLYVDIFTYGDRVNNAIYRILLEETGENTATFIGEVEFIMLNQLNTDTSTIFSGIATASDEIEIIVHEDLTDEDSPRVNYLDLGADGVETQIADQVAAPSHSGVVTFDSENYKTADTVVVTLDDQDLNTDSDLIDVYITSTDDKVGNAGSDHVLDITFNDALWQSGTDAVGALYNGTPHDGLEASGFTLVETGVDSGLFLGSFQVPSTYYDSVKSVALVYAITTTGTDIEVNYNDHRDASGETIEVGAGASINANTGFIEFDRTVYPVPFGNETANERFALHSSASNLDAGTTENALAQGDVTVHIRITDADYDTSAFGEDTISDGVNTLGVTDRVILSIERGSSVQEVIDSETLHSQFLKHLQHPEYSNMTKQLHLHLDQTIAPAICI